MTKRTSQPQFIFAAETFGTNSSESTQKGHNGALRPLKGALPVKGRTCLIGGSDATLQEPRSIVHIIGVREVASSNKQRS